MKNRRIVPTLIYLVLLIAVFSWLSGVFTQSQDQIPYSTVLKLFRNEQVKSFVVDDHVMTMELRSAYNGQTSLTATIADVDRFVREMEPLLQAQTDSGVLEYYHFRPEKEPSAYDLVLPLVLAGFPPPCSGRSAGRRRSRFRPTATGRISPAAPPWVGFLWVM